MAEGRAGSARIDGLPVDGNFTLDIRRGHERDILTDASLTVDQRPVEVEYNLRFHDSGERELFSGLGTHGSFEAEIHRSGTPPQGSRFCPWAARRGWVQLGSVEDFMLHATTLRLAVPNVRLAEAA